ncbi:MAG: hypothetical protein ACI9G1_004852, partial [Pirellulaceae bacterium]
MDRQLVLCAYAEADTVLAAYCFIFTHWSAAKDPLMSQTKWF